MRALRWLVPFCLLLHACESDREEAARMLRVVGAPALRLEAARLYKEVQGSRGVGFAVVGKSSWPPTFQRFRPVRVGSYPDGFSIALRTAADTERGLYVLPEGFSRPSPAAAGAHFEPMAEGVYWYEFAR